MFRKLFRKEPKEDKQLGDRRQKSQETRARPERREERRVEVQEDSQIEPRAEEEKEPRRKQLGDRNLERRERRAAESILENESLTADLDDTAAKELINWGVASAKAAAKDTAGLDDQQVEDMMSERLRATRGLMRSVNKLVSKRAEISAEESAQLLDKINEQASAIYNQNLVTAGDERRQVLLNRLAEPAQDPARIIADLRALFERPSETQPNKAGEDDG